MPSTTERDKQLAREPGATGRQPAAVVYDLDGTLARLAVDWQACEADLGVLLRAAGRDPAGLDAWEILAEAEAAGVGTEAAGTIAAYERSGAADARRLPTADEVEAWAVPVGVCSLNCEAACRRALDRIGLTEAIDVVIGRDSHATRKPDPGPLLAALEALGAPPERSLFVGDSPSDRTTAERAGVQFRSVPGGHTSRSE
ncbi:MAG: HAD family hydrolase [Halobacteriaceae archaeon]